MSRPRLLSHILLCSSVITLSACSAEERSWSESSTGVTRVQDEQALIPFLPLPAPSYINYKSYNDKDSIPLVWASVPGANRYKLHEQVNEGDWVLIYEGPSTSYTIGRERAPGLYRYRVSACDSKWCSSSMWGPPMIINRPPEIDLYAQYPFLHTHDTLNARYTGSHYGFWGEHQTLLPKQSASLVTRQGNTPENVMFHLGQGFDLLKDSYRQICIDTQRPEFRIVTSPVNETSFQVSRVASLSHLSSLLDVSMSGSVSYKDEGYAIDVTGSKKRFVEQVSDSYQEKILVKWERKSDRWTLDTVEDPLKAEFASNMLIPNNQNAQANFRERCGDKYVHSVVRGARLYLVFRFDAKKYTQTERSQKAAELKAAIEKTLTANGSGGVSQETQQLLQQLNTSVVAYAVGGSKTLVPTFDIENFAQQFQQFVSTTDRYELAAIEQILSHYHHPARFINYNYFQIFADYRPALEQLRRWNALDAERAERCNLIETYSEAANYYDMLADCRMGLQEMATAKSRCMETLSWSGCVHPLSYYTPGFVSPAPGPLPSATLLYNWLGSHIKSMEKTTRFESFSHHVAGNIMNKECESFTDETCLPSSSCVVDRSQGYSIGIGQGFGYQEHVYRSPGNGGYHNHAVMTNAAGLPCVRTTSQICSSRLGGTTADYKYDQELFGQCPYDRQFSIVY